MKKFVAIMAIAAACSGSAQTSSANDDLQKFRASETYWSFEFGFNEGKALLGSEDARTGSIWAINYVKPEPWLRFRSNPAQIVHSLYYMPTSTSAFDGNEANRLHTYGYRVFARYWNEYIPGVNTFLDLGWGISWSNDTTQDLANQINSTPSIGLGAMFNVGKTELIFTVRWFHMSNAATNNDNQGYNAFQYTIGVRF